MGTTNLVSIIIPIYNGQKYIDGIIEALYNQTYQHFEVIFVDDGSTDSTRLNIEKHQHDSRIKYFYKKNAGPAVARNYGISKASGEYIAFLDADDKWEPEKLAKQVQLFKLNPDLAMVFTDSYYSDYESKQIFGTSLPSDLTRDNIAKKLMTKGCFILTSSVMVVREILIKMGGFREDLWFSEDWELFFRIVDNYPVDYIDECLSSLQEVKGSLTGLKDKRNTRIQNEDITLNLIYQNAAKYGLTCKDKHNMKQTLLICSVRSCIYNNDYSAALTYLNKASLYNPLKYELFKLYLYVIAKKTMNIFHS